MNKLIQFIQNKYINLHTSWRIWQIAQQTKEKSSPREGQRPVVFFNASTRLGNVSLNAAFAFLSSCGLALDGIPVIHFACSSGLKQCQLGAVLFRPLDPPPCSRCVWQTRLLTANAETAWFNYIPDDALAQEIQGLPVSELSELQHKGMPVGELVLPSVRWVLRRHHLLDDEVTRELLCAFILSAVSLKEQFEKVLDEHDPQGVVVFNGLTYPEAVARWLAIQRGIRVITHEVAHQPNTAFFSDQHVTAYPVHIPDDYELTGEQNAQLDAYLARRFKGDFSMAGVRFWPEMQSLSPEMEQKIAQFSHLVPVFTNVIFDTSQVHANTIFPHMFAWLDQIHEIILDHPETLFVIRAHPDEMRPGKSSRESVLDWAEQKGIRQLENVVYIDAREYISSYHLIHRAKFVMVYNSTIGLEAVLMGRPVLNGGSARYTRHNTVYLPGSMQAHRDMANQFLAVEEVPVPESFLRNARRFQYFQLFRTPLPFDSYLQAHTTPGYVRMKQFPVLALHPEQSPTMEIIRDGILGRGVFLVKDG